jgi:hypothetical protein
MDELAEFELEPDDTSMGSFDSHKKTGVEELEQPNSSVDTALVDLEAKISI